MPCRVGAVCRPLRPVARSRIFRLRKGARRQKKEQRMRLAVLKETAAAETRVAATPETVKKLMALGLTVAVQAGAGANMHPSRTATSRAAGAEIAPDAAAALAGAGVVFAVQMPNAETRGADRAGDAAGLCRERRVNDATLAPGLAEAGIDVAAMELLPRITPRAVDGRAVVPGKPRRLSRRDRSGGRVRPRVRDDDDRRRHRAAGPGVRGGRRRSPGLQAIATARRLGAIVSATDVRPAAKEEIKSLGATFVGVEDEESAGADRRLCAHDERRVPRQTGRTADHHRRQERRGHLHRPGNAGGRAPVIITAEMVAGMKPGSVVVDIAADAGGNCGATKPGELAMTENGVKVLGYRNWPGRIPGRRQQPVFARNLLTFLTTFWDKEAKAPEAAGRRRDRAGHHADPRRRRRPRALQARASAPTGAAA